MAYIYKITNDINNKVYIGKTNDSIQQRFHTHCCDAYKNNKEQRPLYAAMRKYGIENFHIELVEETFNPEEREIYWIEYYHSFDDGYNATRGGDGKPLFEHKYIAELLRNYPFPKEIAKIVGCSVDTIYIVAKEYSIPVKNKGQYNNKQQIGAFDKTTGDLVKQFESTTAASQWCFENNYCLTLNSGVRSHISAAARGKRKTAYGFAWKYIE